MKSTKTSYTLPASSATPAATIAIDEPIVDTTKWTKQTYQKCIKNFDTANYSTNVKSFWAKSNTGLYCNGYSGGKYIYSYEKNQNPCSQQKFTTLQNGEWLVTLRNGKSMRGIAICSDTDGTRDELKDDINTNSIGENCWCKLTQSELSECLITKKFSWQFREKFESVDDSDIEDFDTQQNNPKFFKYPPEYYQLGENTCSWECAYRCAHDILDYGTHRQREMHGVPHIVSFYPGK